MPRGDIQSPLAGKNKLEKTSMPAYRPLRVAPLAARSLPLARRACSGEELLVGQAAAITNPATTANAKGLQAGIKHIDFVNASGGVSGNNVTLVTKDDGPRQDGCDLREYIADKRVSRSPATSTPAASQGVQGQSPGRGGIALIAPKATRASSARRISIRSAPAIRTRSPPSSGRRPTRRRRSSRSSTGTSLSVRR